MKTGDRIILKEEIDGVIPYELCRVHKITNSPMKKKFIPVIPDEGYAHWAPIENCTKITKETHPEYYL